MNNSPYHLERYNTIPYEEILVRGISEAAFLAKGLPPMHLFSIFIKDQNQNVLGGVSGITLYRSLYIDLLWIDKGLRHQGWGTKLMQESEKVGKEHGVAFITLNTMDWQAFPFYEKLGYSLEFVRQGYGKDSKMLLLRKNL